MIERARTASFADALAAAALGLVTAGLVVTGDGLVSAAKQTPGSSAMDWNDRLLLGLWSFRLEHTLWFTLGLVLLWLALAWGATLEGRAPELARLVGGVAVGFVLLAAAVVIGSTIVAISGSIGSGVLEVVYTRDERIFTWLLQVSTAAALIVTWVLAGTRLGERAPLTATEEAAADRPADDDGEVDPDLVELSDAPPTPPAPVPLHRNEPEPGPAPEIEPEPEQPPVPRAAPVTQARADPKPATTSATAQRVFQERLAYSPKRDEARRLLDEIARAEREGREDDAAALAAQLDVM
ncbi:MAG TPA: hypothetical protein VFW26_06765 [Gaiellales bacterium]|nr:hypothetical protein [Gaiellales bacterium]